ncbi:MFS transporter [Plantactinospora sp. DSM 117369]
MGTRDSALAPLRHRPFRYLAIGRSATMLGNAVAPIALAFAVLDLTGSVRDLGLVVGARSLTHVVFLLFGGVLADRLPRQAVMVVSCTLAGLTQGAVAVLVLTGTATIPALVALAAVNGVVAAFAWPAAAALVPQTVPAELLQPANALNRLGVNAAMIGGASLGGALVAGVGPGWGLLVDAATFALAGLAFARVRVRAVTAPRTERANPVRELREGWTEFVARSWVWVVVLGFLLINFAYASSVNVLGPAVADETIGRPAWGVVLAAQTAGMVAGALVALRIPGTPAAPARRALHVRRRTAAARAGLGAVRGRTGRRRLRGRVGRRAVLGRLGDLDAAEHPRRQARPGLLVRRARLVPGDPTRPDGDRSGGGGHRHQPDPAGRRRHRARCGARDAGRSRRTPAPRRPSTCRRGCGSR